MLDAQPDGGDIRAADHETLQQKVQALLTAALDRAPCSAVPKERADIAKDVIISLIEAGALDTLNFAAHEVVARPASASSYRDIPRSCE